MNLNSWSFCQHLVVLGPQVCSTTVQLQLLQFLQTRAVVLSQVEPTHRSPASCLEQDVASQGTESLKGNCLAQVEGGDKPLSILFLGGWLSPHPHSHWIWHSSQKIGFCALEPTVGDEVGRRELDKGQKGSIQRCLLTLVSQPCSRQPSLTHLLSLLFLHLPLGLHVTLVSQQEALHSSGGILKTAKQAEGGAFL